MTAFVKGARVRLNEKGRASGLYRAQEEGAGTILEVQCFGTERMAARFVVHWDGHHFSESIPGSSLELAGTLGDPCPREGCNATMMREPEAENPTHQHCYGCGAGYGRTPVCGDTDTRGKEAP